VVLVKKSSYLRKKLIISGTWLVIGIGCIFVFFTHYHLLVPIIRSLEPLRVFSY